MRPPAPPVSKVVPPGVGPTIVRRQRLHRLLDEASAHAPLTLVLGYAGAGKTVLVASWLAARPEGRHAWLSCDAGDTDPLRFWTALVAAVRLVEPSFGADTLDRIDLDAEIDVDVVAAFSDELRRVTEPLTIVVDDLHEAADERLWPLLTAFVDWLPDGHRIIVTSRTEPALPLHRWRVEGRLGEIRSAHLAFDQHEVVEMLAGLGVAVDVDIAALLARRTEGWAAGIQLAGLSLRDRDDATTFLGDLAATDRSVVDYLTAETLDHQPPEIADFLLATSVLQVLEPRVCGALTGDPDPQRRLREVHARGLFLVPLAHPDRYRYHHLFAELLQTRLRASGGERERALHAAATDWYAAEGDIELAVFHAVRAGDPARAVSLLRQRLVHDYFSGAPQVPSRLIDLLDDATLRQERALALEFALTVGMNGALDEAGRWLRRLAGLADVVDDPTFVGRLAAAQAFWEMARGGAERARDHMQRARALLDPADDIARELTIAETRIRHHLDDLDGLRVLVGADPARGLQPMAGVVVSGSLGGMEIDAGFVRVGERLARAALELADDTGTRQHFSVGEPLRVLAAAHLERLELDDAEELLEQALRLVERERPGMELLCLLEEVWLLVERRRLDDAFETLARLDDLVERVSPSAPLAARVSAAHAQLHLLLGETHQAEAVASRMPAGTRRSLTDARIALAEDRPDAAAGRLDTTETHGWPRHELEAALLRARAAAALGRPSADVEQHVARAATLADEHGFVRSMLVEADSIEEAVLRVLRRAPQGSHGTVLAEHLRTRVPLPRTGQRVDGPEAPSARELEILRYLATSLSNREIAAELYISLNTLKTHVKSLYRKVGVSSRSQAVAWGRARGVL